MIERADARTIWLLGNPVKHSLSPLIQNRALAHLGVPAVYLAAAVEAVHFEQVVRALPKLGALGANVTVPHKLRAFGVCDSLSLRANRIGAVNTLVFRNGEVHGDNTDGTGWWHSLPERARCLKRAVVIGAGGAARAVGHTLVERGVAELVLLNRTGSKAEELAGELRAAGASEVETATLDSFLQHLQPHTLVVQTTSVGLADELSPVPLPGEWPAGCFLSELIYGRRTRLLREVTRLGGEAVDGLGMLCGQAASSLALWLGREPEEIPLDLMRQTARQRLA